MRLLGLFLLFRRKHLIFLVFVLLLCDLGLQVRGEERLKYSLLLGHG